MRRPRQPYAVGPGIWPQDAQDFQKRIMELEKQREKYGIELSQAGDVSFSLRGGFSEVVNSSTSG